MEEARFTRVANELDTDVNTFRGTDRGAPWVGQDVHFADDVEEEEFPCHQPAEDDSPFSDVSSPSDDEQPFVPTEAEKDAKERSVKRPRAVQPAFDALPDLAEIFDNYDTPLALRVSICRAYASYVASTLPKKPRKKRVAIKSRP